MVPTPGTQRSNVSEHFTCLGTDVWGNRLQHLVHMMAILSLIDSNKAGSVFDAEIASRQALLERSGHKTAQEQRHLLFDTT